MGIKLAEIDIIIQCSKDAFKKIKETYPEIRAYLVFSSRFGQANLKTGVDLFSDFPEMFEPFELVDEIQTELRERKKVEKQIRNRLEELEKRMKDIKGKPLSADDRELKDLKDKGRESEVKINGLLQGLTVKDEVFVELRFDQLNFEIIERVKKHPEVSREHTEQFSRSIRIVLFQVNSQIL